MHCSWLCTAKVANSWAQRTACNRALLTFGLTRSCHAQCVACCQHLLKVWCMRAHGTYYQARCTVVSQNHGGCWGSGSCELAAALQHRNGFTQQHSSTEMASLSSTPAPSYWLHPPCTNASTGLGKAQLIHRGELLPHGMPTPAATADVCIPYAAYAFAAPRNKPQPAC